MSMHKFDRDYAVVLPSGKIVLETHDLQRAQQTAAENAGTVVQSELPSWRGKPTLRAERGR
jgi:hypothetical protein